MRKQGVIRNKKSLISKKATIGKKVFIGEYTIVGDNVIIEDNTVIESHCLIGYSTKLAKGKPLIIGECSHIRSHNILYEGSCFSKNLITGHSVFVRENCMAGEGVRIGTHSTIEGDCIIGDYVCMHCDVQVAKGTRLGDFVWVCPSVQFTNDPFPPSSVIEGVTVKDMAVIATGAILLPGITIGIGSFVGAGSVVNKDVPDITCVSGNPARPFARLNQFVDFKNKLSYPWPKHFKDRL